MVNAAWKAAKMPGDGDKLTAHIAMAKALQRDPGESFALAPFAPMHVNGRWYIGAVADVESDAEVLLIDGATGAMMFGDDAKAVGFWGEGDGAERLKVYTNGVVFLRAWAFARADMLARMRKAGQGAPSLANGHHMPGLAMIGDPARIGNFSDIAAASTIEIDNPRLRHVLADAMLRAARLPVVVAAPPALKLAV